MTLRGGERARSWIEGSCIAEGGKRSGERRGRRCGRGSRLEEVGGTLLNRCHHSLFFPYAIVTPKRMRDLN